MTAIHSDSGTAQSRLARALVLLVKLLDHLVGALVVLLLAAIVFDVLAGVVSRYVFNDSFSWTEVGGRWLFIYLLFLGTALGHRAKSHVAVDILARALPERHRPAHQFVIDLIVAYTTFSLLFYGLDLIRLVGGTDILLRVPSWMKYAAIPVAAVVGLVFIALRDLEEGGPVKGSVAAVALAGLLFYVTTLVQPMIHVSGVSPSLVMGIAFLVTLAIGVPVAFAMLFSAFLAIFGADLQPAPAVVQNVVNGAGSFLLLAIPLFILASQLMNVGGLSTRLIDFAQSLVGNARGGLAQVNVVTSFLFGGISGSSGSDAALNAKIVVPQMTRHGYSAPFSCAVTSASSILPNVVPPSVAMLILAAISGASVWKLFIGGIFPAMLLTAILMGVVYVIAMRRGYGRTGQKATLSRAGHAFLRAAPVLSLAIFIILAIRGGVMTPTEAGGLAVAYAFVLGKFVYRGFAWRDLFGELRTVGIEASMIGFLVGVAGPFAFVLVSEQIPQNLIAAVMTFAHTPTAVLLVVVITGLIIGTVLDMAVALLILVPLVMPLVRHAGIDETHFGVVTVITLLLGGLTPPVGIIVFIPAQITNTPVMQVFKEVFPFFLALIVGLLILTFVPAVTLSLVNWVS
ncbi:TRAP transporter large permease subunit [Acuticoccus sp. M5D2P5]|uniref:TRAP transporter large permease n=1 Tax=Acuticoccus kalidii TaxID=2910977 RepID=UPI001F306274|nr:TRAP transporter large permease subunit [Acuticoccus kalidii]MCF3933447.1 TRAP transporter large permease subunit [Acuticoccus kalidii]